MSPAVVACVLVPLAFVSLAALSLRHGLAPDSLFLDDEWVAVALRDAGIRERLGLHLPMPVVFALLAGLPGALVPNRHLALQVLPVLAYLASVGLFPVLVHRLTRRPWAAALGAAIMASAPLTAVLAVRVKHYTLDALVTIGVLLAATRLFRAESFGRFTVWAGLIASGVLVSYASVFLGVTVLCVALVGVWLDGDRIQRRGAVTTMTLVLLGLVGLFFTGYVGESSRPVMVEYWGPYFPGSGGWAGAGAFLVRRVPSLLLGAVPAWAGPAVLLAPLGLVWLWRAGLVRLCLALAGFYGAVAAAAVLRLYPLGAGRTDVFSFPVTTLLICLGTVLLIESIGVRAVRNTLYAACVAPFVLFAAVSPGVEYPDYDDRAVVAWALERLEPDDALVLSPYATFAFAYYGDGAFRLVPVDYYGHGFDVEPERPLSFTSALGRWDVRSDAATEAELARLGSFAGRGPERLMYVETYGAPAVRAMVLGRIASEGYRLIERSTFGGNAEAFLFRRSDVGA